MFRTKTFLKQTSQYFKTNKKFYTKSKFLLNNNNKIDLTPEEDIKDHESPIKYDIGTANHKKGEPIGSGIELRPNVPMLGMFFTCKACDTRSYKQFTKDSYEKGVVLIQCPGCKNLHLVADNLGWFQSGKNVEELLKAKGKTVKHVNDVTELSEEDFERLKNGI